MRKAVMSSGGIPRVARYRGSFAKDARRRLASRLSRPLTPAVMAVIFFGIVSPVGLVMRMCRRDFLRLRFDPEAQSYWLPRSARSGNRDASMTRQF